MVLTEYANTKAYLFPYSLWSAGSMTYEPLLLLLQEENSQTQKFDLIIFIVVMQQCKSLR